MSEPEGSLAMPQNYRQLVRAHAELLQKLTEAEATLAAIRAGEVDGLIISSHGSDQVYTLKTAEHPYRVFVETMNEGAAAVTEDGTIIFCNKCFAEMVAFPPAKIPGTNIQNYIEPLESAAFADLFSRGRKQSSRGEFHLSGKNGKIPVQFSFAKVQIDEVPGVCIVATDLREKRQREELAKDYEWLEKLLSLMPTPVLIFEKKNGSLYLANHAANELFGDDLKRSKNWNGFLNDQLINSIGKIKYEQPCSLTGNVGGIARGLEITRPTPTGEVTLLANIEVLPQMHGRPEAVVLTLHNVTKLKQIEDDLAKASQAKSEFLANMSHEIRTPLGVVLGFAELLLDKNLSDEERKHFLNVLSRNGKQLSNLIDDILDLSKIEAGKIEIERIEISLQRFVSELIDSFSARANEKGIKINFEFADQVPTLIYSDPTRLRQILNNLIGNAIKFTDTGSVSVEVSTKSGPTGPQAVFSIRDSGVGITPAQQARLFQPFTQADNSTTRKFGGTGLGLTLSRKLATALGGDLKLLRSEKDKGSTFEFSLDIQKPLDSSDVQPRPHEPEIQPQVSLAGLKVLLAEDSPDNQLLIKRILIKLGADVECVDNGEAAIQRALNGCHDVVLMDIQMPVLDGYNATIRLREKGYKTPIIALTAHALKEDYERSIKSGCDDHLTKPLSRDSLICALVRHSTPQTRKRNGDSALMSTTEAFTFRESR